MEKHLNKFFKRYDVNEKEYLDPDELQAFCNELFDLNIAEKIKDREVFEELVTRM